MESSRQCDLNDYARKIIRYKARQLVGKYGFTRDDCEDLMQEMALDLLVRLPKFDPDKASLNTFIARLVDRRISTLIRYRQQGLRDIRREAFSLDAPVKDQRRVGATYGQRFSQDEYDLRVGRYACPQWERTDLRLDVSRALAALPTDLKLLAQRLIEKSHRGDVRKTRWFCSPRVAADVARLRNAFEEQGLEGDQRSSPEAPPSPGM